MARTLAAVFAALLVTAPAAADEPVVKPDPPAKKFDWPARVPATELPGGFPRTVTFADHASPFVALARDDPAGTAVTVLDLRTGKAVGSWTADGRLYDRALAPDGSLLAAVATKPPPAEPGRWWVVAIDTTTGKRLWESEATGYAPRPQFAGADRLLITRPAARGGPALLDARTGKLVRAFPLDPRGGFGNVAVSPGGAYLAAAAAGEVVLFGTADGAEVRRLALPDSAGRQDRLARLLAFSPDGRRLAGLFGFTPTLRIVGWDLAAGKADADVRLPNPPAVYHGEPLLKWTADGEGWFVNGLGVVDPDTGAVLWRWPSYAFEPAAYLPLAVDRVVRIPTVSSAPVREAVVPRDRVAAARAAVRSGGRAVDGWLPPLTAPDRSAAEAVTVPARADDWTYRPDGATPAPLPGSLRLPFPAESVESVHVTPTAAVVELAGRSWDGADRLFSRRVVRVDLKTRRASGGVELPPVCRLADVSPDAAVAVTVDLEDGRRVDVWDLTSGRHRAGWRPAGVRDPLGELASVAAPAADRVLTLTRGGELAGWSVPAVRAAYIASIPGLLSPVRDRSGKYVFGLQGDTVRVIEAATGRLAGDLPTDLASPQVLAPSSLAVRADGAELAGVFTVRPGAGLRVVRWDLRTAKMVDRFALPGVTVRTPFDVRYAGRDHLLLWGTDLLGLASRAVEWRYRPPQPWPGRAGQFSPDGRVWYAAGEPGPWAARAVGSGMLGAAPRAVLVSAELPHPAAAAAIRAGADPRTENLLAPGHKVGVRVELTDPPDDKTRDAVRAAVRARLTALGLEPADETAAVVLVVSVQPAQSFTLTVRKLVGAESGPGTPTAVRVSWLSLGVRLTVDGRRAWGGTTGYLLGPQYLQQPIRLPDEKTDLRQWLAARAWGEAADAAGRLLLPPLLVRAPDGPTALPGFSALTADGPAPAEATVLTEAKAPPAGSPRRP